MYYHQLFNFALEKVIRFLPVHQGIELLGYKTIRAYVNDIMVIGCSCVEIITKTAELITVAEPMGLEINQNKTKYMVISRRTGYTQNSTIGNYIFQAVTYFKYLGTNVNNANNMHSGIKLRISTKVTSHWENYLNQSYYL